MFMIKLINVYAIIYVFTSEPLQTLFCSLKSTDNKNNFHIIIIFKLQMKVELVPYIYIHPPFLPMLISKCKNNALKPCLKLISSSFFLRDWGWYYSNVSTNKKQLSLHTISMNMYQRQKQLWVGTQFHTIFNE